MVNDNFLFKKKTIQVREKPIKQKAQRFPWPRTAEDNPTVELGVDVQKKRQDIIKIVHKFFHVPDISMEELLQEVFLAIIHKNYTRSAHDPRKSSFGHYVFLIANNVCINLVHRKKRYAKESESLDVIIGDDDSRTLLDTIEPENNDVEKEKIADLKEIEEELRNAGFRDAARYILVTSSGAKSDVIREVLSFGNRNITSKSIRDYRFQVQQFMNYTII